jgi:hypothetical protein
MGYWTTLNLVGLGLTNPPAKRSTLTSQPGESAETRTCAFFSPLSASVITLEKLPPIDRIRRIEGKA